MLLVTQRFIFPSLRRQHRPPPPVSTVHTEVSVPPPLTKFCDSLSRPDPPHTLLIKKFGVCILILMKRLHRHSLIQMFTMRLSSRKVTSIINVTDDDSTSIYLVTLFHEVQRISATQAAYSS